MARSLAKMNGEGEIDDKTFKRMLAENAARYDWIKG